MNVIIFGAPGAGKGTQANNIAKKYYLHQVSTGDLLRDEIKAKSEIGKIIENIISKGSFATDNIVNQLIKKTITNPKYKNNFVLDGYPRNINQAKYLELILNSDNQIINFVIFLKVSRDKLEKRILGRITCDKCNKIFNEYYDKNEIDKHDCGINYLIRRGDDNFEVLINRYDEYMNKTKPVLEFYSSKNNFYEINGDDKIDVISSKIEQILSL